MILLPFFLLFCIDFIFIFGNNNNNNNNNDDDDDDAKPAVHEYRPEKHKLFRSRVPHIRFEGDLA